MKNILVFLSIVFLIDCAVLPRNQIEDTDVQNKIITPPEPVQDYANIETTQQIQENGNIRNGDQLKRCSDYDIVSSSYQPDAVLALSRREINLLERNRERCELCRNNPICKKDITICRTCKRICDSVAEQMATTTTTATESTENNIQENSPEPVLGQQQQQQLDSNQITMRFGDESTTNYPQRYFSIGAVQSGPRKDLIAKLFNVDNNNELEQFIILGKLKQDNDREMVRSTQPLFIWDLGRVFGLKQNQSIPIEIHSINDDNRIDDNNKKIDLAEELNKQLDKAIRNRKKELGQSQLNRDEIDNLINTTMTKIMNRSNDTVGCSLEEEAEEFDPIIDLRNRPQTIHKSSISNPPVIQNSYDPKLAAKPNQIDENSDQSDKNESIITQPIDTITDDKIVGETLLTSTEAQPLPESDNQIVNMRDNDYDSNEESGSYSDSLESDEQTYVGANQPTSLNGVSNLPNLIQNTAVPENLHKDITKIVQDSFKIPGNFRQTGEDSLNSKPPKNLQNEVQNVIEDSLKLSKPTANPVEQHSPDSTTRNKIEENLETAKNLQTEVQKIIEDSLKMSEPTDDILAQQGPHLPNNEPVEGEPSKKLQEVSTDHAVGQQSPHLSNRNELDENLAAQAKNLQEEVQKVIEDSLKMSEPTDNTVGQQSPNLPTNQVVDITTGKPAQKSLQEEVQKIVEDSLKVHEPTDDIVGQQTPNLPTRNMLEEPQLIENPSLQQTAPAQIANTTKTVTIAPYEGMPADKMPKVFPYHLARPIPNKPEYNVLRQFEGMPAEKISKVFPDHLARPFTQLPDESTNGDINPTVNEATTTVNVRENDVGSPILENRGELFNNGRKFHTFGSLIPASGQNDDNTSVRNVYFLGKDIALPLRVYQDPDGVMQLSVDMEKLCNCKNKTCMKTHKNLEEFGNNLLKHIETEQINQEQFEKTSDIMKRSPKIDNFPNNEENGNYLDFEDKLNKLHKVVENFEKENENLLEESTKILLKNVANEGKAQKSVDLINKMLKWVKNVVTQKQN